MGFICPVCGESLLEREKDFICKNSHLFDKAKKGYVNLLMSSSSKIHGDTKQMLRARERFLDAGFYSPLKERICAAAEKFAASAKTVLDCGCGEGYYTASVGESLKCNELLAVDISKDALIMAKKRDSSLCAAVASVFKLPVNADSVDLVLNIFSPLANHEFLRVLKPGGYLIRVIPLEEHLWQLKSAVYDVPYKNEVGDLSLSGFELVDKEDLTYSLNLTADYLKDLFCMTPYFIKTSKRDSEKLNDVNSLKVTASFGILVYKKV